MHVQITIALNVEHCELDVRGEESSLLTAPEKTYNVKYLSLKKNDGSSNDFTHYTPIVSVRR